MVRIIIGSAPTRLIALFNFPLILSILSMVNGYICWYFNSQSSGFDFTDCLPSRDWKARVALSSWITLYACCAFNQQSLFYFYSFLFFFLFFFFYLFCIEHLQRSVRFDGSIPLSNNKVSKRIIIEVNNRCLIDRFPL